MAVGKVGLSGSHLGVLARADEALTELRSEEKGTDPEHARRWNQLDRVCSFAQ